MAKKTSASQLSMLSSKSSKAFSRRLAVFFKLLGVACFLVFMGLMLQIFIYKWAPVTHTHYMRVMSEKNNVGIDQTWVPLSNISPNAALAVVASEDNLFTKHSGVSWTAIERALKENAKGKRMLGGSTISQQTAKNVFLWNGRSYIRKGIELVITYLIEAVWGKERIMEVYLNVVELGPGVYGVETASQRYFHHSAKKLSRQEAALMAAVLPNPVKRKISAPTPYLRKRQADIVRLMRLIGKVDYNAKDQKK